MLPRSPSAKVSFARASCLSTMARALSAAGCEHHAGLRHELIAPNDIDFCSTVSSCKRYIFTTFRVDIEMRYRRALCRSVLLCVWLAACRSAWCSISPSSIAVRSSCCVCCGILVGYTAQFGKARGSRSDSIKDKKRRCCAASDGTQRSPAAFGLSWLERKYIPFA